MIINPISYGGSGLLPEIIVTAAAGSTLDLLQNGVVLKTYTLGSTETQHTFVVKNVGEYTVKSTLGDNTYSSNVLIETVGQYPVTITGKLYLYNLGDECESITGGWFKNYYGNGSSGTAQKNDRSMTVRGANNSNGAECGVMTKNSIDFSKYMLLNVEVNNLTDVTIGSIVIELRSSKEVPLNGTRYLNTIVKSNGVAVIDISSINNICYIDLVGYYSSRGGDIYKVWLE